jgi:hypothetical protein
VSGKKHTQKRSQKPNPRGPIPPANTLTAAWRNAAGRGARGGGHGDHRLRKLMTKVRLAILYLSHKKWRPQAKKSGKTRGENDVLCKEINSGAHLRSSKRPWKSGKTRGKNDVYLAPLRFLQIFLGLRHKHSLPCGGFPPPQGHKPRPKEFGACLPHPPVITRECTILR